MKISWMVMACAGLFLSGCASTQKSALFVMNSPKSLADEAAAISLPDDTAIVVATVHIPEHLDRATIVTQAGDNQLAFSEFSRWAGSLDGNLRQTLIENLGVLLQSDRVFADSRTQSLDVACRVDVWVKYMSGVLGESARLQVQWGVQSGKKMVALQTFTKEVELKDESYAHYVSVQSALWAELSQEIAAAIRAAQ